MIPGETRTCPLNPTHLWHGLPRDYHGCPGEFGIVPRKVPERMPCARCSTGIPVEHTCREAS